MNFDANKKIIKKENVQINEDIKQQIQDVENTKLILDGNLIELISNDLGFYNDDKNVFQLLGLVIEGEISEMLTSINHKN